MTKRYWGVIITYILLYFSIYLFEPLFLYLFDLSMEASNAYGRIIGYSLAFIVVLILMKPDIKNGFSNAYSPKRTILWCIYGVLIYFLVQFVYGLIAIVLFNMEPKFRTLRNDKNQIYIFSIYNCEYSHFWTYTGRNFNEKNHS
jgi:hypothetical protein